MSQGEPACLDLIDDLIGSLGDWDRYEKYYLTSLLPRALRGQVPPGSAIAGPIAELHRNLTPDEWHRLPDLVADRRAGRPVVLESDREILERRELAQQQAREEEERRRLEEEKRGAIQAAIRDAFEQDFPGSPNVWRRHPDSGLLSEDDYAEMRTQFVREWSLRKFGAGQQLDDEQARAVGTLGGDIEVVARAGSGKTRTLVAKAIFLLEQCGVEPHELMLLAFNRAAAAEMRERLEKHVDGRLPHTMTFHALAHALVHPDEELVYDEDVVQKSQSMLIQDVIDEHIHDEHHGPMIRDVMLAHFRDDWEHIVEGGFDLPIEELIAYRKALPRETLAGDYVKSFGEKVIANTLFENAIDYKYERNRRWNGVNYRPDFTVLTGPNQGVVIEYFGLIGDRDYDEMSAAKRAYWATQDGWTLLEFTPRDVVSLGIDGFAARLLDQLSQAGIPHRELSPEDLWELIRGRALDKFTGAMRSFVGRCRKNNLDSGALRDLIDRHTSIADAEQLFLEVGVSVYQRYLDCLRDRRLEDFDGLLWRAIERLREGNARFVRDKGRETGDTRHLRYVLVDEFQDFSDMFYGLTQEIRSHNQNAEFFCVGDDWQAINGFAGSDLKYFQEFDTYFRNTQALNISTNYRSAQGVVQAGNALMRGRGNPAVPHKSEPGWVRIARMSEFVPSETEYARHEGDEVTPALLRLTKRLLDEGRDVVMLSRVNRVDGYINYAPITRGNGDGLERFAEHIRHYLPEEDRRRVSVRTTHKYKGREKEAVIVLGADEGRYPLIHPNWVFLRVFGDSLERIEAEERRLFYVALTRSGHSLAIITDDPLRESPYLAEIRSGMPLMALPWKDLPPVASQDGARLEVRVHFRYDADLNESLKGLGYHWKSDDRCWARAHMAEDFDPAVFWAQPWTNDPRVRVELLTEAGELIEQR